MATSENAFERVARRIDPRSRLLRAWQLQGGVSAQVTALEIARPDGTTQKLIVRRHGERDLKQNPHVAAGEFRLLQILHAAGLPAPRPYHLDPSGEIFPTPYLVIEYVDGQVEFAPADLDDYLAQIATQLARIHRVNISDPDLSFLPSHGKGFGEQPAKLDESLDEGRIREALESAWPLAQLNRPALLHGDFWPGNILWKEGRIAAVLDWEDARLGDPLADLANCRLEILWAFGAGAMQAFTGRYQALATIDFTNLPYWDLCAALRSASRIAEWGLDDAIERQMRQGHKSFVAQALQALSA